MAVQNGPQQGSWVPLNKLVQITLAGCFECEEIPRLDHLPNLKSLELEGFKKVRFINSSFTSLTSFSIDNFRASECLPDWLFYNNPKLSVLTIISCPSLTKLPDGLHALTSLQKLSIFYCSKIGNISGGGGGGESKPGILVSLRLWYCERLMELPRQMVESWASSLENVSLYGLSSLGNLPIIIECLTKSATHRLRKLSIVGVPNFMAICSSGESWPLGNLLELSIGCSEDWSREKSSEGIIEKVDGMLQSCCTSLTKLELIGGMDGLECLPQSIQHLTSLSELELKDFGVEELPEWLGSLPSLKELNLIGCSKLRRLNLSSTTQLRGIHIKICPELDVVSERCRIPDVHIRVY